jgi:hypothetical protein
MIPTVTACRTDLIWLKDANYFGEQLWSTAISLANELNDGECGLSDGSVEGDWRLPTKEDLQGLGTDQPVTFRRFLGFLQFLGQPPAHLL